jgi:tetratricopeptide (TPR) repeat protein
MQRSLHWKRLAIVVAATVVLSGSLFALNRVQSRRQASVIKSVALQAEAAIDGDKDKRTDAITHFETYLRMRPDDEDAAIKYAKLLFDQHREDPSPESRSNAAAGVERILRRYPEHPDERRKLIDLYIKMGKIRNALEHIDVLFNSPKGDFKHDVDLLETASLCEFLSGKTTHAVELLDQAIQTGKAPVRVYQQILTLLNNDKTDPDRERKIPTYVRTLLEKDPFRNDVEARIAVARFQLTRREYQNAQANIEYAQTKIAGGDSNPEVLLAAAEWQMSGVQTKAEAKPRLVEARRLLEKGFAKDPRNVQIALKLADILDKQGESGSAVNTLREAAKAYGPINDQYWVLIDYLLDLKNQDLSSSLVERAAAQFKGDPRINYFRGRLALLNNDWMQARTLLEETAPQLVRLPAHHKRAMAGLATVYGVLQNPDQQLNCYRSALHDDAIYYQALIGEAEALAALGKLDEAITRYETLVTGYQITELRPTLARLRLLDIIRRPPEKRNWSKFDSEGTLGPANERSSALSILYAQSLSIRGDRTKAIEVLRELLNKDKSSSTAVAWVALARIQEAGKPEAALQLLEDAKKQVGDMVELRLARADILVFRDKPPTAAEFEQLGAGADKSFSKPQQYRLLFGLGQAALHSIPRVQDPEARRSMQDAAIRFLRLAGQADPQDLHCRAVLIDLALATDRKDALEAMIDEVSRLEGPNGPISTLARVSVRLAEVKAIQDADQQRALIRELREQIKQVQKQRPGWGRVYVAHARLDELEGLNDQAVEHFRQAINEGDLDELVIRKTVALYRERKQDAAATAMLDELSTKMILPEDLERYRAIYEMVNRTVPRSERPTIDRIAPASSRDSRILMLRGELLTAIRDEAEALRAFRRAIELAADNPETWQALIRQLMRTGDQAAAKQALAEAEQTLRAGMPKTDGGRIDLFITLGECYEMCGDMKTAGERYQEALRIGPKELKPNRRMVEYLVRLGQQNASDQLLEKLSEDPSQDLARWARRYLATVSLLSRPDPYLQRGRALELIARNLAGSPNDPEDLKAQAYIHTIDPAKREDGIRVLKEFWAKGDLTPDESYHLGMLLFNMGPSKIPESVKYFEAAARPRLGVSTEHIAGLVRIYLALDQFELAEATLDRLRAAAPSGWETLREESRLLMKKSKTARAKGDRDEAARISDRVRTNILKSGNPDDPEVIRTRTGPLLAELGFLTDAETLYRKLTTLSKTPAAHVPLAVLYIQSKKTTEAINLAREFESRAPTLLTAQILASSVRVKAPSAAVQREVEDWINDKIARSTNKAEHGGLLAARAELFDAQGKYAEAIAEYRKAIQEAPSENAVNNLAMLLALYKPTRSDLDEAIELITRIIDVRGPQPTLLDTRAVAYIVKGGDATEKAVDDLKMALLQHSRAVYAYHLAWAYDLKQKRIDREKALEEARSIGIQLDDLHPLEQATYRRLCGPDLK